MPRKDAVTGPISAQAQQELVTDGIENFELPKSIVTKIAKSAVPDSTKLQKDTILSLVKGSTVFINYLAATAHDVAYSKQHKSISASDVLKALELLEFGDLAEQLQTELALFRESAKSDKGKPSKAGTTNGVTSASTATKPKGSGTSIIIPGKTAKGKEKEQASTVQDSASASPFTSAPLQRPPAGESISSGPRNADVEMADESEEPEDDPMEEEDAPVVTTPIDLVRLEQEELLDDAMKLEREDARRLAEHKT